MAVEAIVTLHIAYLGVGGGKADVPEYYRVCKPEYTFPTCAVEVMNEHVYAASYNLKCDGKIEFKQDSPVDKTLVPIPEGRNCRALATAIVINDQGDRVPVTITDPGITPPPEQMAGDVDNPTGSCVEPKKRCLFYLNTTSDKNKNRVLFKGLCDLRKEIPCPTTCKNGEVHTPTPCETLIAGSD